LYKEVRPAQRLNFDSTTKPCNVVIACTLYFYVCSSHFILTSQIRLQALQALHLVPAIER